MKEKSRVEGVVLTDAMENDSPPPRVLKVSYSEPLMFLYIGSYDQSNKEERIEYRAEIAVDYDTLVKALRFAKET